MNCTTVNKVVKNRPNLTGRLKTDWIVIVTNIQSIERIT